MRKLFWAGLTLFIIILVFSRFYNVEYTARFTEDESGFLVRAHQIYGEKKITLVGQVNELGTKVFSSLSIYMLLPAAILGNFDPASMFYGAAFWGVLTGLSLLFLAKKVNPKLLIPGVLVILFWFPLVNQGRWAWNPNFIPLWISLALICYLTRKPIFCLLAGVFLGLSVHQHYYAIFAISVFAVLANLEFLIKRQFRQAFLMDLGIGLTLIPFIIFDLRHPPGIFLLGATKQAVVGNPAFTVKSVANFSWQIILYYTQSKVLGVLLILTLLPLVIYDSIKKSRSVFLPVICFAQIILVARVSVYFSHYFYALIPFFFVWLIYPRVSWGRVSAYLAMGVLIIGGLLTFKSQLTVAPVEPDLTTVKRISLLLKNEIRIDQLKNVDIAVLASPDHNTNGRKYRDLLLIPDNLVILTREEMGIADNLFVVSTVDIATLRQDPAYELNNFRGGVLRKFWKIGEGPWTVYLLNRK